MDKITWQKVGFHDKEAAKAIAMAFLPSDGIKKIAKCLNLANRVRLVEQLQDFSVWREDKTGFRFTVTPMR